MATLKLPQRGTASKPSNPLARWDDLVRAKGSSDANAIWSRLSAAERTRRVQTHIASVIARRLSLAEARYANAVADMVLVQIDTIRDTRELIAAYIATTGDQRPTTLLLQIDSALAAVRKRGLASVELFNRRWDDQVTWTAIKQLMKPAVVMVDGAARELNMNVAAALCGVEAPALVHDIRNHEGDMSADGRSRSLRRSVGRVGGRPGRTIEANAPAAEHRAFFAYVVAEIGKRHADSITPPDCRSLAETLAPSRPNLANERAVEKTRARATIAEVLRGANARTPK